MSRQAWRQEQEQEQEQEQPMHLHRPLLMGWRGWEKGDAVRLRELELRASATPVK